MTAHRETPSTAAQAVAMIFFLALCLGAMGIGAGITAQKLDPWYLSLARPPYAPPDWLYTPVWGVLYLMMAYAAFRVWRREGLSETGGQALMLFIIQLTMNLFWPHLFFGGEVIEIAFGEIMILFWFVVGTAVAFRRIDRLAGWLLAPYVLWVAYAAVVNYGFWVRN